jgi:endonuclease YncB( thermonuclease family)
MMIPVLTSLPTALALLLATATTAAADTRDQRYYIAGPVEADLVSVIDGDTLMVTARPWPQQTVSVLVRIRGIDTPELHAKCPQSRQLALAARDVLAEALTSGEGKLTLSDISGDKYFGRVVAKVTFDHGHDVASTMLAAGLARPYDGGRKGKEDCN